MSRWRLGIWPQLLLAPTVGILLAMGVFVYSVRSATSQALRAEVQQTFQGNAALAIRVLSDAYLGGGVAGLRLGAQAITQRVRSEIIVRGTGGTILVDVGPHNAPANCQGQGWMSQAFTLPGLGMPPVTATYCEPDPAARRIAADTRLLIRTILPPAAIGFLAAILLAFLLNRSIGVAVTALGRATRRFAAGDLRARVPVSGPAELADLASDFNRMASELEAGEEQRRNLVADVAHELRTPLTVLRGYLEALKDGVAEPEPDILSTVHLEAVQLQRLVDDLQELAQAESRELGLEPAPVQLDTLLPAVAAGLKLAAQEKGVELRVDVPAGTPQAWADFERIAQVLRNLVTNALRYTPAGGAITMRALAEASRVRIEVRDTGIGIAPEHRPHVFERFYRVDPSRARETGGSGLGLTIAKRIVEAHNGEIGVEENPGGGCCFWFTLPLAAQ